MRKTLLPFILIFCMSSQLLAAARDFWFPVGEKLSYRLYWGIIPVGHCEMTTAWVTHGGKEMLAIRAIAKTTSVVSKIYPVDDFVESIINPETFLPFQSQGLHLFSPWHGRHSYKDSSLSGGYG